MAFKTTLTPVTLFTGFDPYYYATDNIPLNQLSIRDNAIADQLDLISIGRVDISGGTTPTVNAIPAGWSMVRNSAGDYTITHNLNTLFYSVFSSCQSTTAAHINQYASTNNTCSIRTYNTAGTATDMQFALLVTRL